MAPKNTPERSGRVSSTTGDRAAKPAARNLDDLSQADVGSAIRVAATEAQRDLLQAALDLFVATSQWPTAAQLAIATDVAFPVLCSELKSLARLGLVRWMKRVVVLRMPDGLFFVPTGEHPFAASPPRGAVSEADCYGVR